MGVLGNRHRRLQKLVESGQVGVEGGLSTDLFGLGPLNHRPVINSPGQQPQRRSGSTAENAGRLRVGQRRERAHRVDAQPAQSFLGHRADPPQSTHRKTREQQVLLVASDHPHPVGLGQSGGDLRDLLARPGTD